MSITQTEDLYVNIRLFRRFLSGHLAHLPGRIVGSRWAARAVVIPIPAYSSWDPKSKKKAVAEVKRRLAAVLAKLR